MEKKRTKNKRFCVYKHTSPNGKIYIGITSTDPLIRWGKNGNGYKNNKYFANSIQKYGWDNFQHEILYTDLSKEEACEKETELIAKYKSNLFEFGFNRSSGGENAASGVKRTKEERKRISAGHKGQKPWNKGKRTPDDVKKKLSESHKDIFTGAKNPHAKKVFQFSMSGDLIKCFDYMTQAAEETGICLSSISFCVKGRYKSAGGYRWKLSLSPDDPESNGGVSDE